MTDYEAYDELYQHILDLQDEIDRESKELQYMGDYLSWRNLWDDYSYFRLNARLEQNEGKR